MKRLFTLAVVYLVLIAVPVSAKDLLETQLEKSLAVAVVRKSIISRGLANCKARNHRQTIHLLKTFLNHFKVSATPLEKRGYHCLALAYQSVGESAAATETIERTLTLFENSPIEQADFEYTAGIIAYRQDRKVLAVKHWQKARQLYLENNAAKQWLKTTFDLAFGYQKLGQIDRQQQLLLDIKSYKNKFANIQQFLFE
ncbi:hypothetical protein [Myxosarcina sp. GI1]|uniref:hypothetical protein n=1 Tax=Myxosarcina sp. GI1 TaxID=1541065 RepID=UPI0012E0C41F|nr:hypothetical protein [Myxosarcina sp. GI1]